MMGLLSGAMGAMGQAGAAKNGGSFMQGVMEGKAPSTGFGKAATQQGLQNANALGMSALRHYQPMQNWASNGVTMGLLNNAANTPRQFYREQFQSYHNPYVTGLLGGV